MMRAPVRRTAAGLRSSAAASSAASRGRTDWKANHVLAVALEELIAARVAGHAQAQALYRKARAVEQVALRVLAEHRPQAHLQTNVEFYTALLLHAIGLERELFTPTFAVARVVGWLAHAGEQRDSNVLLRPRARYRGPHGRRWLPRADR